MSNVYDILWFLPGYEHESIHPNFEGLAQQLVRSGLLRINADHARNFITYSGASFDKSFSKRELTDPHLMTRSKQIIADTLPGMAGARGVESSYQNLLQQFKTTGDIPFEREMQIARLLVQACHPSVMLLLMHEGVQIFVSYSHNVADLLAVHFWDTIGHSGGLQSISGDGKAVYVSCGGNPFITEEEHKTYTTDGFPAMARMMVIAGQELGHYADIMRNSHGQVIGRHSAMLHHPMHAKQHVRQARLDDIRITNQWAAATMSLGLNSLIEHEKALNFYKENRKRSASILWEKKRIASGINKLKQRAAKAGNALVTSFTHPLYGSDQFGHNIALCLRDMAFNLAPDADAYRRDDPDEEEAIACIEALARVPQQVNKWGHEVTRMMWPKLYDIYYEEVIPANIRAYERATGKTYHDLGDPRAARVEKSNPLSPMKLLNK